MSDINYLFEDDNDEPNSTEYEAAIAAWREGFNVIPLVPATKRACVKYAPWHHHRQTLAEVVAMRNLFDGGLAVITGVVSGIVVIDTDGPKGERIISEYEAQYGRLPMTRLHRSGSGRGWHRLFCHPCDGRRIKTVANPAISLDIKGDGGIVVFPPSFHKSGGRYTVDDYAPIAPLPGGLITFIEIKAAHASGRTIKPATGIRGTIPKANMLSDNVSRRVPLNRWNVALVQSMLATLPDECAEEYDTWLKIGFAVHSFDGGRVGRALWENFSMRCPVKAAGANFEKQWAYFDRSFAGRPITIGTLWAMAVDHGWRPKPWRYA